MTLERIRHTKGYLFCQGTHSKFCYLGWQVLILKPLQLSTEKRYDHQFFKSFTSQWIKTVVGIQNNLKILTSNPLGDLLWNDLHGGKWDTRKNGTGIGKMRAQQFSAVRMICHALCFKDFFVLNPFFI